MRPTTISKRYQDKTIRTKKSFEINYYFVSNQSKWVITENLEPQMYRILICRTNLICSCGIGLLALTRTRSRDLWIKLKGAIIVFLYQWVRIPSRIVAFYMVTLVINDTTAAIAQWSSYYANISTSRNMYLHKYDPSATLALRFIWETGPKVS